MMKATSNSRMWIRFYGISFLLLLVPVLEVFYLSMRPGGLSPRFIVTSWAASGVIGIVCVFIGSGGVSKKPIDKLGKLALVLHITSIGFLMLLAALVASGNT